MWRSLRTVISRGSLGAEGDGGASVPFWHKTGLLQRAGLSYASLHSLPRCGTAEKLQRKQELTRLTPKRSLIPAQPVERIGGQVCQADEGSREVGSICVIHSFQIDMNCTPSSCAAGSIQESLACLS